MTAELSNARQSPVSITRCGGVAEVAAAIATIALVLASGAALGDRVAPRTLLPIRRLPHGNTVRVEVSAKGMAFHPNSVTVAPGDKLELVLTNDDKQDHDLKLASGAETARLSGRDPCTDAGLISADVEGWCTIAGHRMQGMTFMVHTSGDGEGRGPPVQEPGRDTLPQVPVPGTQARRHPIRRSIRRGCGTRNSLRRARTAPTGSRSTSSRFKAPRTRTELPAVGGPSTASRWGRPCVQGRGYLRNRAEELRHDEPLHRLPRGHRLPDDPMRDIAPGSS